MKQINKRHGIMVHWTTQPGNDMTRYFKQVASTTGTLPNLCLFFCSPLTDTLEHANNYRDSYMLVCLH